MVCIKNNPDRSREYKNDFPMIQKDTQQGILYKTSCYLAGPMEFDPNGQSWRDKVSIFLNSIGVRVFDPYSKPFIDSDKLEEGEDARKVYYQWLKEGKFDQVAERMKPIRNLDLNCVDRADFLIFYINKNIPTFGTIEELVTAVKIKRPIFIYIEGGKENCPLWLFGMLDHRYFYSSIEEIINKLDSINSGKESINNDKWRLLKSSFR